MTLAEAKKLEKCNHDDCLRDGVRPNCWSYQEPPPTIQDAKKTMENWKRYLWGHFDGPDKFTSNLPDLENLIKQLIEASAIIAASEQREKDIEIIKSLIPVYDDTKSGIDQTRENAQAYILKVAFEKILSNPPN